MSAGAPDRRGLLAELVGDGRPLLTLTALALLFSGGFALFLSARREFLPHDIGYLGMTARDLCAIADCRIVGFMFHDRVAFGGTLIAIGILYLWLIRFPLAEGARWAWWTLAGSAGIGFLTFLSYLGTGYLDSWHGVATLALLPLFGAGLWRTRAAGLRTRHGRPAGSKGSRIDRVRIGRWLLLLTGAGMVVAGLTITTIGTLVVFVPQDLAFIGLDRATLDAIDPHLVPLIAHDRAGFGGGLATTGLIVVSVVRFGRPSRALWQALALAGIAGFGAAIGVHGLIGYLDITHVGPAILAAGLFAVGMALVRPSMPAPSNAGPASG
jgi:hypothetical protein